MEGNQMSEGREDWKCEGRWRKGCKVKEQEGQRARKGEIEE